MTLKLLISAGLTTAMFLGACSEPEQALREYDQPASSEQTQKAPPPPHQIKVKEQEVIKPAQHVQTPEPVQHIPLQQPQPKPVSVASTPFNVKRCMNIGNALEAPNEGEWGYKIRARDFQTIKRAGFDTVRIPIRWDTHTAHRAPYKIDPPFMSRIQTVVSQAQSAGLGVIIDVHHYESLIQNPRRQEARFMAIWSQIADTFRNAPSNVYFEAINEPTREISMTEVNALYAKLVPLIRKTNPTRKIILGGNSWNSVDTLDAVKWPKDANLVATYHDYGPHEFTHQGAEWSEPVMPLGRKWGGRADEAELKDTFAIATAFKRRTGLPLFVGEFGVIDKVPQAERNQWTKMRRKRMEAAGISWCAWDMMGAFKTYDIATEQWRPGVLDALFSK